MSCGGDSPSAAAAASGSVGGGGGEFMLFGVRVKVDPMRKCVSLNNLSEYQPLRNTSNPMEEKSDNELHNMEREADVSAVACYVSADDTLPPPSKRCRDRKRGIPWTEEEHRQFLIGLQKVGRGDWRGISKNYVKTRKPTQVASHAQKYFIRKSNLSRRRRRSSLFDITTDSVNEVPSEIRQDAPAPPQTVMLPASSRLPIVPLPVTALLPMWAVNNPETPVTFLSPVPTHHWTSSTPSSLSKSQWTNTDPSSSLSLRLSLSMGQDNSSSSTTTLQVLSNFKNGDSKISVA